MVSKLKGAVTWIKKSGFGPALYKIATKKTTVGVIVGAALGLIGWDVVVATNKEKGDTISEVLLKASKNTPLVGVAWGILTGHLFWPQDKGNFTPDPEPVNEPNIQINYEDQEDVHSGRHTE